MSLPLLAILTSASMSFQFHSNGWFPSVFFPVHWTSATNVISNSKSLQIGPKIILSICNEEISLRKLNIFSRVYICDWHGSIVLAASSEDKPYFVPISLLDRMKAAFIWKKSRICSFKWRDETFQKSYLLEKWIYWADGFAE